MYMAENLIFILLSILSSYSASLVFSGFLNEPQLDLQAFYVIMILIHLLNLHSSFDAYKISNFGFLLC